MPKGIIALRKEDFDGLRYGVQGHFCWKKQGGYKERHSGNKQLSYLQNKNVSSALLEHVVKEGCGTW